MHLLIIPFGILALGLCYQLLGRFLDSRRFPPPGRLVTAGKQRLHILCAGEGAPPVVLESGIAASSINWYPVQREIATFTRVCAYDRAGYGWSGPPRSRRTPESMVSDLRALLAAAGEEPPYILVGHSFGGLVVRLYAASYPDEVVGIVLVDPALLTEWANPPPHQRAVLQRGVRLARRGAWLARVGFVRLTLALASAGARTLTRSMGSAGGRQALSAIERIIGELRKLPPALLPAIRAHWSRPEPFDAMGEHFALLPDMCAALARSQPSTDIPVTVISGAHLTPEQRAEHTHIASASKFGRHVIADRGGHWVHLDAPDVVVDAVRQLFHGYGRAQDSVPGVHVS